MQVVKDPLKTKGARLSMELTIAGPLHGLRAAAARASASRAGCEDKERDRLRKQTARLDLQGGGAIIRTAAHGAKREDFERELKYLHKLHEVLEKRVEETRRPGSRLPGGRPVGARRARHLLRRTSSARSSTTSSSTTGWSRSSRAPRRSWSTASSCGRSEEPLFEAYGVEKAIDGDALAPRRPAERRLSDHRLRRGADRDRRQLRLVHRPRQGRAARGHDHEDEPRGGRGGRPPAAPARHRRDHRHRLHRHGPRAQPRRRAEDAAQDARRGPHEDVHRRDLAARAGRDDAPERDRGRARDHDPPLPDLRGRGRDPLRGDDRDRVRAQAARAGRERPSAEALPGADQPARDAPSSPATARGCCARSRSETGKSFLFEGSEGLAARPLRDHAARARATRSRSARCRSARATRCSSRSSSRTCTTWTTRSRRSTATSSRSPAAVGTSARSGWCASTRSAAPRRRRRWSTTATARRRRGRADDAAEDADGVESARSAPWPQRRTAPFPRQGRRDGRGRRRRLDRRDTIDHVRDRQDRRQAVPRRGGPDTSSSSGWPPTRARRSRSSRCCYRGDETILDGADLAKVKVEAKVVAPRARARSCASSSSSPSAATSGAPATARS